MLRIKTEVRPSKISGMGLFAAEVVEVGTVTWVFDEGFDQRIASESLNLLPLIAREFFLRYGFFSEDGKFLFHCSDDLRFINHSQHPNIGSTPFEDRALRNIAAGEELTCDYLAYESNWFQKRGFDPSSFQ